MPVHTINLGRVVGPQGPQGNPGQNGVDGKDGANGRNGANGQNGGDGVGRPPTPTEIVDALLRTNIFDQNPTFGSSNLVRSGSIYNAINSVSTAVEKANQQIVNLNKKTPVITCYSTDGYHAKTMFQRIGDVVFCYLNWSILDNSFIYFVGQANGSGQIYISFCDIPIGFRPKYTHFFVGIVSNTSIDYTSEGDLVIFVANKEAAIVGLNTVIGHNNSGDLLKNRFMIYPLDKEMTHGKALTSWYTDDEFPEGV